MVVKKILGNPCFKKAGHYVDFWNSNQCAMPNALIIILCAVTFLLAYVLSHVGRVIQH
jgi:hypothetical protein